MRVALDLPLGQLFDYTSDQLADDDLGRRVLVPFGNGERVGIIAGIAQASDIPPERLRPASAILRDTPPLPADWLALMAFCSRYYHCPLGEMMAVALPPRLKSWRPLQAAAPDPHYAATPAGAQALAGLAARSVARKLLQALLSEGAQTRSALRRRSGTADRALAELAARGWIERRAAGPGRQAAPGPALSTEQQAALAAIGTEPGFRAHLLHGVTGSGKTEIYLRLIEAILERGGQSLLLTPEIGLTPQLQSRVRSRFPGACVVALHSGLAEGERARGFLQALTGEADIVLGTRLAVFTPLPRLALLLVDEEHDPSFKQQEGIRYSARDVAVYRAKQREVPIVLGSATPSLESWQHARAGRYARVSLTRRAVAETLPGVRCVDTRRLKLADGLSPALIDALAGCLARGEQSLVFLNRRGYAPVLACPACGWASQCSHCAANRVLHLADRRLRCHHCGDEAPVPLGCPTCGNQDIHPFGRGTQRLEAHLAERFPGARVLRVDRDSARTPARWHAMLEQIRDGGADILVGTQMLAKGHDFPRLTLVGVLNADASLFSADFRAPERLFSQLMQVGGRSGRAALPGEVLIQTEYPEHPLYRALAAHDYAGFAAAQLAERQQAGVPPFAFQALLRADAPALAQALGFLREAAALAAGRPAAVQVYDPVPMRLARRADRERAQLLVESASRKALHAFLTDWLTALRGLRAARELRWHVDVDPLEF